MHIFSVDYAKQWFFFNLKCACSSVCIFLLCGVVGSSFQVVEKSWMGTASSPLFTHLPARYHSLIEEMTASLGTFSFSDVSVTIYGSNFFSCRNIIAFIFTVWNVGGVFERGDLTVFVQTLFRVRNFVVWNQNSSCLWGLPSSEMWCHIDWLQRNDISYDSAVFPEYGEKHILRNSCEFLLQYVASHPQVICAHSHCHENFRSVRAFS